MFVFKSNIITGKVSTIPNTVDDVLELDSLVFI
jgi:hypothetical protein